MALHAFYKLVDGTLEIDGVKMHQTFGRTPFQAANEMVSLLSIRPGDNVLDICTGLGYSAIEEARRGALVTTIEVDPRVLELARQNPASKELFEAGSAKRKSIKIIVGNALEEILEFKHESFHAILHDPPRFSFAGELYSQVFYNELFRVLSPGGRLFHYTGKPGEKSGKNYRKGIKERLGNAGFNKIEWQEAAQGFSATKHRIAHKHDSESFYSIDR